MGQKLGPMNIAGTNTHCGHARNVSWTMQVQLKRYCGLTWYIAVNTAMCSSLVFNFIAAWTSGLRPWIITLRCALGFELWRTTLRPTL